MHSGTNPKPRQWVLNEDGSFRFDAMPIFNFVQYNFYSANELKENLQETIDYLVLTNAEDETPDDRFPAVYRGLTLLRDIFTTAEFKK
jgi:hypothetical protein